MTSHRKRPTPRIPRYVEIADELESQIVAGVHAVDATLPPEVELCARFGVSRFTVRAALAMLQRRGYLTRRPRVGSVVVARDPQMRFSLAVHSPEDLLRFSGTLDIHPVESAEIEADADLAVDLGCAVGEHWIRVSAYRTAPGATQSESWTDFYLRPEHRSIVPQIGKRRGPVHALIEAHHGGPVERVEQRIDAFAVSARVAKVLGVPVRSPALRAVYRLHCRGDEGRYYAAISVYPAGRFSLLQTLTRET